MWCSVVGTVVTDVSNDNSAFISFETSETTRPATQCHIPEHVNLQQHHCGNLKCHTAKCCLLWCQHLDIRVQVCLSLWNVVSRFIRILSAIHRSPQSITIYCLIQSQQKQAWKSSYGRHTNHVKPLSTAVMSIPPGLTLKKTPKFVHTVYSRVWYDCPNKLRLFLHEELHNVFIIVCLLCGTN
jgi:hypothetical protein